MTVLWDSVISKFDDYKYQGFCDIFSSENCLQKQKATTDTKWAVSSSVFKIIYGLMAEKGNKS